MGSEGVRDRARPGIKENWSWRRRSQGDLERESGAGEHSKSG
jgi:hypothetical protein